MPRRTTLLAALVIVAALLLPAVPSLAAPATPADDAPPAGGTLATETPPTPRNASAGAAVTVMGHGWGHGRGLGQYGAYGYAADAGWTSPQILDHFYGDTAAGNVQNPVLTVRMVERDGQSTVVALNRGQMTLLDSAGRSTTANDRAVRIDLTSAGTWQVYDGPGCAGPWTARSGTISASLVRVMPAVPDPKQTSPDDALQMCLNSSDARYVRGNVLATQSSGAHYTVNELTMDSYLKGVVPRESPASWPAPALEAQAVAARSYAYAESRYSFAKTCDTTACQVYGGWQLRSGGTLTPLEDSRSNQAVAATSGLVRTRGGSVMRTEFSASTGGYTAGGLFPAVPDAGDSRSPYHTWTTSVPASSIEAVYRKGTLVGASVVQRNGLGEDGGRVVSIRLDFTGGSVTVSGESFRSALGLRSDWYSVTDPGSAPSPAPAPGPAPGGPPVGGYVLSASGALTAFGKIHAPWNATTVPGNLARAVAVGGPTSSAGYVLSGRGTLIPFNQAPPVTTVDFGFDVARDVVLRRNGRSGWVLEAYGGLHEFGGAPAIRVADAQYKAGDTDWARRMVLRNDQSSGYITYRDGIVLPFGGAPAVRWTPMPVARRTTDLVLAADGVSGWVVDDHGNRYPFSPGTPGATVSGSASGVMASAGRPDGSAYLVTNSGTVIPVAGAPAVASPAAPGPVVDVAAVPQISGYVLDGYGGLHPFGGAADAVGETYRLGQDWARRVVVRHDGAGYVLDANGRLFPFGTTSAGIPSVPVTATWPGWDIARDVAMIPGTNAGYTLDGWGGLHPFNGAPTARVSAYWPGWDIARRLVIDPSGNGGYVLDGYGGLHPFTIDGRPSPAAVAATAYTPRQDIFRDVVLTGPGRGYTIDAGGGLHPFGYGGAFTPPWPSGVGAAGMATDNPARASAVAADCQGGVHVAPDWEGTLSPTATWPGWCIARDIAARPAG